MLPSPSVTSSFSRQSRPRHARAKVASGGLRGYTGFKVFEKPGGTRDFSLFEREARQSSALTQTNSDTIVSGFGAGYYIGAQVEGLRGAHSRSAGVIEFIGANANGGAAGPNFNGILTRADTGNPTGIGLDAGIGVGLILTNATNVTQTYGTVMTTNVSIGPFGGTFGIDSNGIWTLTGGVSKGWGFGITQYPVTTH